MTKEALTRFAFPSAFLGLVLSTSPCLAQGKLAGLRGIYHRPAPASQLTTQTNEIVPTGSPSYKFTLLNFPGWLSTLGLGINSGAASSRVNIVGAVGDAGGTGLYNGGFLMHYTQTKGTTTESFRGLNITGVTNQAAGAVNDSGQVVGWYTDSSNVTHGYLESSGKFTTIDVPFSGATGTLAFAINNSGEIVGYWTDATTSHGFLLSGSTYTSVDYPGAVSTLGESINNSGEIVGFYGDTSGVSHGFSLSGGTYTSIDVPGSTFTAAVGINDAGDIVGQYCLTTECASGVIVQGFLLSGGTYTTITIPGATATAPSQINNKGLIVGFYDDALGSSGFLATPK